MKYFLLLTAIYTQAAFAELDYKFGEWGSGGGNAVVCFPKGQIAIGDESYNIIDEIKTNGNKIETKFIPFIESIEMYDLFEAKKRRGVSASKPEILEIKKDEGIYSYIDRVGERYKLYNPFLTNLIPYAKKLIPDSKFIHHDYAVKYHNDMGEVTLPNENCVISTVAGQVNMNGRENGFYEVHIDSRLYNHKKFSKQSKATLILHELIYALARKHFDHKNSASTRNLVRFYISHSNDFTEEFIAKSLSELGFNDNQRSDSQIWKDYHFSSIMNEIGLHMESLHNNLKVDMEYALFTDHDGDGQIDPTQTPEKFQLYMNSMIETEKEFMKESLEENANVDEKLMKQILLKFDFYNGIFDVHFGLDNFNAEINISSEEAFKNIYRHMLHTTSCSGSFPPEEGLKELTNDCVGPIKLTNQIPRA